MRKYRFMWLALIPLGTVGALATGLMPLPWQSSEKPTAKAPIVRDEPVQQAAIQPDAPAPKAETQPAPVTKPRTSGIDVARISGDGSSVIAGYAAPGVVITIMADGVPIGVVTPDANGEWVLITSHKFANLSPTLTIRPGDHLPKNVASLSDDEPTPTTIDKPSDPAKPIRTAAAVTDQMLRKLKALTKDARDAAERTKNAKAAAKRTEDAKVVAERTKGAGAAAEPAKQPAQSALLTGSVRKDPAPSKRQQVAAVQSKPEASGAKPASQNERLPVPVQFIYRKAEFTERGREAAALLLAYFKAKEFDSVVLSGHADERGSEAANKALSKQRLLRIKKLLRDGGFNGRLELLPMGETQ